MHAAFSDQYIRPHDLPIRFHRTLSGGSSSLRKRHENMQTDIAVIGGGAIGAAVAYYAKTLDPSIDVTVIERDPTYELASTPRASGGVRRLFSLPENIELSNYSIPFFESFAETVAV